MPFIRDWTFAYTTVTTGTTIACTLPQYAVNDLLVAILSADTYDATGSFTAGLNTGWSVLFLATNTVHINILYKIAGAGEANPTFTSTDSETYNCHLVAIGDVNTTTPFNGTGGAGTGYITGNSAAGRTAMPNLTTTVNNSLILRIATCSAAAVPGVLEGACIFEDAADGSAHSDGLSWGFMPTAGVTPTVYANMSSTSAGLLATIGISPPSGGATVIPTYCSADLSVYLDPIHGITAYNTNTAFAATATTYFSTTLNGQTLGNGTAAAAADVGINSYHSMGRLTGVTTAGNWSGGALVLATANKPNVAGKNVICHIKPSTPKVYQNTDPIAKAGVNGLAFGMCSAANTDYRVWHVHGKGTNWNTAQHVPVVINDGNTTGRIQNTGTLNTASILAFGVFNSGFTVAPIFDHGSLWVLDTTTVCGGNSTYPVTIPGIVKACATGKERMSVLQEGTSQMLMMQPIQIGNGGTNPVYLDLNSTAIEIPAQYSIADSAVYYCSVDNVAGLTYYPGASDIIKHRNSVISSKNKYHWGIHASASVASSVYDFTNLSIIGAGTVSLKSGATIIGASWTSCDAVAAVGAILQGCSFNTTTGVNALTLASTAECAAVDNCSFTSNTRAIKITATGTYEFNGHTFSGNTYDIENSSAGTVIVNNINGSNASTFINTGGGTTVINNPVTVSVTCFNAKTLAAILNARVLLQAATGGPLPYNASVTITCASSTATVTHTAHGMVSGQKIVIKGAAEKEYNGVYTITYISTSSYSYTVTGTPASPATGTILCTGVVLDGLTDSSGILQDTAYNYKGSQPVSGKARKGSAAPLYQTSSVLGTITNTGVSLSAFLVPD